MNWGLHDSTIDDLKPLDSIITQLVRTAAQALAAKQTGPLDIANVVQRCKSFDKPLSRSIRTDQGFISLQQLFSRGPNTAKRAQNRNQLDRFKDSEGLHVGTKLPLLHSIMADTADSQSE
jgi:hypothetical protein